MKKKTVLYPKMGVNRHYVVKTKDIMAGSVPSGSITMNGPTGIVEGISWGGGASGCRDFNPAWLSISHVRPVWALALEGERSSPLRRSGSVLFSLTDRPVTTFGSLSSGSRTLFGSRWLRHLLSFDDFRAFPTFAPV